MDTVSDLIIYIRYMVFAKRKNQTLRRMIQTIQRKRVVLYMHCAALRYPNPGILAMYRVLRFKCAFSYRGFPFNAKFPLFQLLYTKIEWYHVILHRSFGSSHHIPLFIQMPVHSKQVLQNKYASNCFDSSPIRLHYHLVNEQQIFLPFLSLFHLNNPYITQFYTKYNTICRKVHVKLEFLFSNINKRRK